MHDPQRPPPIIPLDADPDVYRWATEPIVGPVTRRGLVWIGTAILVAAFWTAAAYLAFA